MRITVLYFARLREAVGRSSEELELPAGVDTLGALRRWILARGEPWSAAFDGSLALRAALDQVLRTDEAPLHDGAEVAFFPPVTGG